MAIYLTLGLVKGRAAWYTPGTLYGPVAQRLPSTCRQTSLVKRVSRLVFTAKAMKTDFIVRVERGVRELTLTAVGKTVLLRVGSGLERLYKRGVCDIIIIGARE